MKKIQPFIAPVALALAIIATCFSVYLYQVRPHTAYVNLGRLYNEFELKKQLENQLTSVQQIRKKTLDSLEMNLNMLSRNIQSLDGEKQKEQFQAKAVEFDGYKQQYLYQQKNFTEDNANLTEQYTGQIWKQLNQYVKDYGEAQGYTYILGGDGTGSMMYANHGEDITEQLITYTNERFKGESKSQ